MTVHSFDGIMTLHIFNPEHDLALAAGTACFTPPPAALRLRRSLGFLPALWAAEGDAVLADDAAAAVEALQRVAADARQHIGTQPAAGVIFVEGGGLKVEGGGLKVEPWGWDAALRGRLCRMGVPGVAMPGDGEMETVRELSHRRTSARLAALLQGDRLQGVMTGLVAKECYTVAEVREATASAGMAVLKAPWSSSGRGVRLVGTTATGGWHGGMRMSALDDGSLRGWLQNVIKKQGGIMVEPYHRKVMDFGMEFEATDAGVAYCGLSLFTTAGGAYTGNLLATERVKRGMMEQYVPSEVTDSVRDSLCRHLTAVLRDSYRGPLGVDMMVCNGGTEEGGGAEGGYMVHPCVEINLRRTMGHVALALTPAADSLLAVMQVRPSGMSITPLRLSPSTLIVPAAGPLP